eukprot:superscaffoldBa00000848_g7580
MQSVSSSSTVRGIGGGGLQIRRLKFEIAEVMTEIEQLTCVGERDDFNIKVLQAFVELHEFADLNLVQALRQFLWSFRLPGEAQKIDRMMEAFASRYCQCNPGVFQSTDTCYVLSFAIIMLNTSLHNPNVRDKPPVERFISMNRGINEGGDLPEELLRNLYDSIKNEPFKIPEDDGNDLTHTFFNPDREGWLLKLGGRVKTWKRRWFILTDNCLYYFEYTTTPCQLLEDGECRVTSPSGAVSYVTRMNKNLQCALITTLTYFKAVRLN